MFIEFSLMAGVSL